MVGLFIQRPIATTLLALGLALAGFGAFFLLPVSPLPNIDIPTIVVQASMAGASPETMSTSVATPLERHLGAIAAVTEMTSRSSVGSTQVVLQFDISRDIDGAARDVQAAINASRADLPAALRSNPTYRKFNPSNFPIMILALTSKTLTPGQIYDQASNILQQRLSQVDGVGDVELNGASLPAVRIELNPRALFKYGIGLEDVRAAVSAANANSPKGGIEQGTQRLQIYANDSATEASDYKTLVIAYRNGAAVRLQDVAEVSDGVENVRNMGIANGDPAVLVTVTQQPGANVIDVVDAVRAILPELQSALPQRRPASGDQRPHRFDPQFPARRGRDAGDFHGAGGGCGVLLPAQSARHTGAGGLGAPVAARHLRGHVSGGLQSRQFLPDGPDHLDRLCGG